jgi:hypothetical protein
VLTARYEVLSRFNVFSARGGSCVFRSDCKYIPQRAAGAARIPECGSKMVGSVMVLWLCGSDDLFRSSELEVIDLCQNFLLEKDRDSESAVDYFGGRYDGLALGRFTRRTQRSLIFNPQR